MKTRIYTRLPNTGKRVFIEKCLKVVNHKKGKIARDFIFDFGSKTAFKRVSAIRVTQDEVFGTHSGWSLTSWLYRQSAWKMKEVSNKDFLAFLNTLPEKKK